MKKLVATLLTILTCGAAYALPLGNPSEASLYLNGVWWESACCDPCDTCFDWCDAWALRIGFYGDYVFDRHLEENVSGLESHDVQQTKLHTNAGYLALNICDRVDIFGTLGASDIHIVASQQVWNGTNLLSEVGFRTDFSWSVGARATLWECNCLAFGIEGQYFQTRPRVDYFIESTEATFFYFNELRSRYREWQVGLGASYRFATSCPTIAFVPYIGVKYARSKLDMDQFVFTTELDTLTLNQLESKKRWGYAVGISITLSDMIGVTVEGRWADERALYVNGQFRF